MEFKLLILCFFPMICAAVSDAKKRIIPDWTWISILIIGGIPALFYEVTNISITERVAGLVLTGLIMLFVAISAGGIGGGDIKR